MAELSRRRQRMLVFIQQYFADHSRPPTVREIGEAAGISSTSVVAFNLTALEKLGYIRRDPEVSRGLELVDHNKGKPKDPMLHVPIVGLIAAGEPIEAVNAVPIETMPLAPTLVSDDSYILRVKGKSMIEDLIDDGDLVVVRPQESAEDGDIVVALLINGPTEHGEATLKRFYRDGNRVRLQPANSSMQPMLVEPAHLRVQGRVVALIRRML